MRTERVLGHRSGSAGGAYSEEYEDDCGVLTNSFFNWMFRNRATGQITVVQIPNIALSIYLVTVVLRWIMPAYTAIDWIAVGALAWWAVDELFRGVNPWRRLLGLCGCVVVCTTVASLLR